LYHKIKKAIIINQNMQHQKLYLKKMMMNLIRN